MEEPRPSTQSPQYARKLAAIESSWSRRFLDVQIPYRWNLRRLKLGFTLDVGAGIGRNLRHLKGNGIGVDHSAEAVRTMRARGLRAFLPGEFLQSEFAVGESFDSLLFAHVLEHMPLAEAGHLVGAYLPYLKKKGRVVVITPQQAGFRSDSTHVTYIDAGASTALLREKGLAVEKSFSFPLPPWAGSVFKHNEFVVVGRRP